MNNLQNPKYMFRLQVYSHCTHIKCSTLNLLFKHTPAMRAILAPPKTNYPTPTASGAEISLCLRRETTYYCPLNIPFNLTPTPSTLHYPTPTPSTLHYPTPTPSTLHYHTPIPSTLHYHTPTPSTLHYPTPTPSTLHYPSPTPSTLHYPTPTPSILHYPTPTPSTLH